MILFGFLRTKSLGSNYYALVAVDDFSNRYTLYSILLKIMLLKFLIGFSQETKLRS